MSTSSSSNITNDESTMQKPNETALQAQSRLSGLKAPSKIVRPTIQKPSITNATTSPDKQQTSTTSLNEETTTTTTAGENSIEFRVNDRCWVNGTKAGTIAFLGETQFKEGVWAGVILDEIGEGKNNGTVGGVTYFKTEEARGVFCRPNKLTRVQEQAGAAAAASDDTIKIGSRVCVNSNDGNVKVGILRFLGTADFAKGDWAGIELSEKLGKNDGSVLGKRYFTCEPLYGLFAPANKISLFNSNSNPTPQPLPLPPQTPSNLKVKTQTTNTTSSASKQQSGAASGTPFVTKTGLVGTHPGMNTSQSNLTQSVSGSKLKLNKQLSGSQESLVSEKSSIYSTASGVATASSRKSLAASQQQQLLQKSASKVVIFLDIYN